MLGVGGGDEGERPVDVVVGAGDAGAEFLDHRLDHHRYQRFVLDDEDSAVLAGRRVVSRGVHVVSWPDRIEAACAAFLAHAKPSRLAAVQHHDLMECRNYFSGGCGRFFGPNRAARRIEPGSRAF